MESIPNSIPFKSKKPILSTTPKKPPPPPEAAAESAIATPERPIPPPRIRNRNPRSCLVGSDPSARTPEKLPRSVDAAERPNNSEKSATLLPEKYKMLCEFFDSMVNSIRLLRLKRLSSTFTKLCRNIESLTERRFTLHHLAQLKHIMPEVLVVKKIRVQEEETNCMKEELLILLEADAVEIDQNTKGTAGFSHLKGIFRARIMEYSATHPEGDDIPEGELPHLFYMKKDPEPIVNEIAIPVAVSHISPSFKRRFSSRALNASVPESSPAKTSSWLLETPIKETPFTKGEDGSSSIQGTPAELASTPSRLMATTPALRPPKRSLMSPDHDSNDLPTKSAKRRSLKFDENCGDIEEQPSNVGDDENNVQSCTSSKDVIEVLPKDLLHSLMEKERRNLKEQDPAASQAIRRHKLMAGVPKLFDMICLLFQSMRRSIITKEELIHKIIAGHLDIVDRREVEEQLKLLQEVAPEYICEQPCLSGSILLRLNKSSCPSLIRAKLLEA